MQPITPKQAKEIIRAALETRELPFTKLTAKTVSFADLARGSGLFVKIHGWQPNPKWAELKEIAKAYGFFIED